MAYNIINYNIDNIISLNIRCKRKNYFITTHDECKSTTCKIFDKLDLDWGPDKSNDDQDKSTMTPKTTTPSIKEIEDELDKIYKKLQENLNSSQLLAVSEELKILLDDETLYDNQTLTKTIAILDIMADKTIDLDESDLRDYTDYTIESIDKLIDQELAWEELDSATQTKYGSRLLDLIQTIGHHSGCLDNDQDQIISKNNIILKRFPIFNGNPVYFDMKNFRSAINVHDEVEINKQNNCSEQIAIGSFTKKLSMYMDGKLKNSTRINSNIVSLSLNNTKDVVYFDRGSVEIRCVIQQVI